MKFGYFTPIKNVPLSGSRTRSSFWSAVKTFQSFSGLRSTGILDVPTKLQMNKARCGNPDMISRRKKRFMLSQFRWKKETLTYRVIEYPQINNNYMWQSSTFTKTDIDREIDWAFTTWAKPSGLKFFKMETGKV
jgi:hypothetical protein